MNIESVLRLLERRCRERGAQSDLAREMGLTPQFISAVLTGRRQPSPRLLAALGLEEVRSYRPMQPSRKSVRNGAASATVARQKREGRNHAKSPRAQQPVD